MIKKSILRFLNLLGYHLIKISPPGPVIRELDLPDANSYQPLFCPWYQDRIFNSSFSLAAPFTLVTIDRCYIIWTLASQSQHVEGEFWECGVYRGGTARLLADNILSNRSEKNLRLFDTFSGMPTTGARDFHVEGDFSDTSIDIVRKVLEHNEFVTFHVGKIPDTFGNETDKKISFAHIDVDIYQSVLDCCKYIYPRLSPGAVMLFDDYGYSSCPGARQAVDEFFRDKPECPLVLSTAQAIVTRLSN